jgi:hypothetical protein
MVEILELRQTDVRKTGANMSLAKVAVQCFADTFVVNQSLVLRINICGESRHLRQARKHYASPYDQQTTQKPTIHFNLNS